MRICYYNPQVTLGRTLISVILRSVSDTKYSFLLDFLKNNDLNTAFVVDGTATTLNASSKILNFISNNYLLVRIISFFEIYIWCILNRINPFKHKIIFSKRNLNEETDVIIGFAFLMDTFVNPKMVQKSILKDFQGPKVFHFSHYFSRTKTTADSLRKLSVRYAMAESDISLSDFFKQYFSFIDEVYILPFVLRDRYKNRTLFSDRNDKCFAIGTELILGFQDGDQDPDYKDYREYYKTETLQPMRNTIRKNKEKYNDLIDSFIKTRYMKMNKNRFVGLINKFKKRALSYKNYFSFNIVDKYNEYKMFVSPEENVGLPSVNFVEGMACGCAYLGIKNPMYDRLGLIDGVNYIGYNGSIEDLRLKITYYLNHQDLLNEISRNGEKLVKERFSKNTVLSDLLKYLNSLVYHHNLK